LLSISEHFWVLVWLNYDIAHERKEFGSEAGSPIKKGEDEIDEPLD